MSTLVQVESYCPGRLEELFSFQVGCPAVLLDPPSPWTIPAPIESAGSGRWLQLQQLHVQKIFGAQPVFVTM